MTARRITAGDTAPVAAVRDGSEYSFVVWVLLLTLGLTSLPYLFAHYTAPADREFMGIMLNVPDHVQYFSWMRELTDAHLAANKLTPEPNAPVFFNLLWWGMGRLGRWWGLDFSQMFQVLRLVSTTLFLFLVYRMTTWFLPDIGQRRAAFLVTLFSSGFGWVLVLLKYTVTDGILLFPLDVYISEANTFLNILAFPHFVAAALYIVTFDLMLRGQQTKQWRYPIAAGLVAAFLGWQHAYDLILVYGILGVFGLLVTWRDRRVPTYLLASGLIIGLLSGWPALYSWLLTSLDPLWAEVLEQFANAGVYTPNLLHLPILLGVIFLLALYAALRENPIRRGQKSDPDLFLAAWFWGNFFLIYIPTDYQVHMLNGWQVPMAILAVRVLFRQVIPALRRRLESQGRPVSHHTLQQWLMGLLILAILPTNLYLLTWRFVDLARHDYPYYLHRDEIAALEWLEEHAREDDVILASETVGQYVPALTGSHAFLAHWAQTVDYYEKDRQVARFYGGDMDEPEGLRFLAESSIDYVVYGSVERGLGNGPWSPPESLSLVFDGGTTQVYAVAEAQGVVLPLPRVSEK